MSQITVVEMLKNIDKDCLNYDVRIAIEIINSTNMLEFKHYKFLSGPFKGKTFISNAPNKKMMNKYPNFKVIFTDSKFKNICTSSLITYDQQIEEKTIIWQKLLSDAHHI